MRLGRSNRHRPKGTSALPSHPLRRCKRTCVIVFDGKIPAGRRYLCEEGQYLTWLQCGSDPGKRGAGLGRSGPRMPELGGTYSVEYLGQDCESLQKYRAEAGTTQMKLGVQTTHHFTSHANSPCMDNPKSRLCDFWCVIPCASHHSGEMSRG